MRRRRVPLPGSRRQLGTSTTASRSRSSSTSRRMSALEMADRRHAGQREQPVTSTPTWDHVADGDGGDCGPVRPTRTASITPSSHGARTLERQGEHLDLGPTGNRDHRVGPAFYPPLEANGKTVAQAGATVFLSRDGGGSFTEVALPGAPVASAMHMPSPDALYVGPTDGRLFRLSWSGTAWGAPVERPRRARRGSATSGSTPA